MALQGHAAGCSKMLQAYQPKCQANKVTVTSVHVAWHHVKALMHASDMVLSCMDDAKRMLWCRLKCLQGGDGAHARFHRLVLWSLPPDKSLLPSLPWTSLYVPGSILITSTIFASMHSSSSETPARHVPCYSLTYR